MDKKQKQNIGPILENKENRELLKHDFALQNFKEIGNTVKEFRDTMGSYFSQLATFDLNKAEQDKIYVRDTIKDVTNKLETYSKELEKFLADACYQARVVNGAAVYSKYINLGTELAGMGNPIGWVIGETNPNDAVDRADELADAARKLLYTEKTRIAITKLVDLFAKIQEGMKKNQVNHENFLVLTRDKTDISSLDIEERSQEFVNMYGSYSPGLTPDIVTEYTATLEHLAESICELTVAEGLLSGTAEQITIAVRGDPCFLDMQVTVAKMMANLEQMMDLQDDMMDAGADMARALIARSEAKRIVGDSDVEPYKNVEFQIFSGEVPINLMKWLPFMSAYIHRRSLVAEICHEMKYRNFGKAPEYCSQLKFNPVPNDISQLISWKYIEPTCSTRTVKIKGVNKFESRKNTINVKALYEEGEAVFEITNVESAKKMGWIDPSSDGVGVYVKQFALYLPPEEGDQTDANPAYKVEVDIYKTGGANYLNPLPADKAARQKFKKTNKFLLPTNVLKTVYKVNEYPCQNPMSCDPYKVPFCKPYTRYGTCKEQEGKSQSDLLPSLFGEWQIKLVNNHPTYENLVKDKVLKKLGALRPDSDGIRLQAVVTVCEAPNKPTGKDDQSKLESVEHKRTFISGACNEEPDSTKCCRDKGSFQVWKINDLSEESCAACSNVDAASAIGGYYCKLPVTSTTIKKKTKKIELKTVRYKEKKKEKKETRRKGRKEKTGMRKLATKKDRKKEITKQ